jgi:hypothetical protein
VALRARTLYLALLAPVFVLVSWIRHSHNSISVTLTKSDAFHSFKLHYNRIVFRNTIGIEWTPARKSKSKVKVTCHPMNS